MKWILPTLIFLHNAYTFEIRVTGNTRTNISVIEYEIADIQNLPLNESVAQEVERRLYNLRIFSNINTQIIDEGTLSILVSERWTTIPIFKFAGGGGSSYYVVGAYDINSFGENLELGVQYENLNNRPAGVIWYRSPHFFNDRNLKIGIDIWNINRVRFFYTKDGENDGAFTLKRNRLNLFTEKKWDSDFYTLGFNFTFDADEITEFGLTDEQTRQNIENNFRPNSKVINRFLGTYIKIGRLNQQTFLLDGKSLELNSTLVSRSQHKDSILADHTIHFKYFKRNKYNHNFGWQFRYRGNNLPDIQNLNYLGGLGEVRGYMDGQYFDNSIWHNNLEYRILAHENSWAAIQVAIFSDQAKEGKDPQDILNSKQEILLSSGVGLRFISPKIFRFIGRLDLARAHTRSPNTDISFGVQQFF